MSAIERAPVRKAVVVIPPTKVNLKKKVPPVTERKRVVIPVVGVQFFIGGVTYDLAGDAWTLMGNVNDDQNNGHAFQNAGLNIYRYSDPMFGNPNGETQVRRSGGNWAVKNTIPYGGFSHAITANGDWYIVDVAGGIAFTAENNPNFYNHWSANMALSFLQTIVPSALNGHRYRITTTDGFAGAAEPVWPLTAGGTVSLDGITYTENGDDQIDPAIPQTLPTLTIYRSTDDGDTWSSVFATDGIDAAACSIAVHPTDGNKVCVAYPTAIGGSTDWVSERQNVTLAYSDDGGDSWSNETIFTSTLAAGAGLTTYEKVDSTVSSGLGLGWHDNEEVVAVFSGYKAPASNIQAVFSYKRSVGGVWSHVFTWCQGTVGATAGPYGGEPQQVNQGEGHVYFCNDQNFVWDWDGATFSFIIPQVNGFGAVTGATTINYMLTVFSAFMLDSKVYLYGADAGGNNGALFVDAVALTSNPYIDATPFFNANSWLKIYAP